MAYPSDLSHIQWQCIEKIAETQMLDRKRVHSLRSIINAIFYVSKDGIQGHMMPSELPLWRTVYYYYRKWRLNGFWQWLHDCLHKKVRHKHGKADSPSIGILDSQSVKTANHTLLMRMESF